jgi:formate-dependent nitrite reductase cytochrome c552 subunit
MMKKLVLILLAVALVAGMAMRAGARVVNTPHDIAYPLAGRYVCENCHTAHQGASPPVPYLLWNRNRNANITDLYASATFDMGPASNANIGPQTLLCMVCHDGQASTLQNYPGPGSPGPNTNYDLAIGEITGWANLGTSLAEEHPVGFIYNSALDVDGNGFPPLSLVGAKYVINAALTDYPVYDNNTVQCATCHSVHDTASYDGKGTTQVYFLRTSNDSSAMCTDCHTLR